MILLVSGATATMRRYPLDAPLGHLVTPATGNAIASTGRPWAADNAAFTGFDVTAFIRMLDVVSGRAGCLFVSAPDVVGDAGATARLFEEWAPRIAGLGLPIAWVAQDGAERLSPPWQDMQALFIGGTTGWKLGAAAEGLASEARRRGVWVHMGRVNTRRRFIRAAEIGCDSVDGSGFSKWPDNRIPKGFRWIRFAEQNPTIFSTKDTNEKG